MNRDDLSRDNEVLMINLVSYLISSQDETFLFEHPVNTRFYSHDYKALFEKVCDLNSKRKCISQDVLMASLKIDSEQQRGFYEAILFDVFSKKVHKSEAISTIDKINENSVNLALFRSCNYIDSIVRKDIKSEEKLSLISNCLDKTENFVSKIEVFEFADLASKQLGFIESCKDKPIEKLHVGIKSVDNAMGGMRGGDLIIIAGRPGSGKTCFSKNFLSYASLEEQKVGIYFSFEMKPDRLVQLSIQNEVGLSILDQETGNYTPKQHEEIMKFIERQKKNKMLIHDSAGLTVSDIESISRNIKRKYGRLDYICIDYLQLVSSKKENRYEAVSEVSRSLKCLAKTMDIAVIALAQLNRETEKRAEKRPMASDIKESGQIEQDADIICILYRPELHEDIQDKPELKGFTELVICKNRYAGPSIVELEFEGSRNRFKEMTQEFKDNMKRRKAVAFNPIPGIMSGMRMIPNRYEKDDDLPFGE